MANQVFDNLLKEQIDIFKSSFIKVSREIYTSTTKPTLTHPAEFGRYREEVSKRFLRFVIPSRLDIAEGFLINTADEVSTQCDIVVFDSRTTPLIQDNALQRFFPVETTVAVGEVKSILSKVDCKRALNKLARVKKMAEFVRKPSYSNEPNREYSPEKYAYDRLTTFLVCQKLDFDLKEIISMYDDEFELRHQHNMILSLEDGLILYSFKHQSENDGMHIYPVMAGERLDFGFYDKKHSEYEYLKLFCHYIFMATSHTRLLYPEFSNYMVYPENKVV